MGYKILSVGTLVLSAGAATWLGILTFSSFASNQTLFAFLASCAVFLMALRFNIVALKRDVADKMVMPNIGLFLLSIFLYYLCVHHYFKELLPDFVQFIVLGGLVLCFGLVFMAYWFRNRRSY